MSVLKWPDRLTVDQAVKSWVESEIKKHPDLKQLGYYGSYARGDWGVGSDLDLIAVVDQTNEPFERRSVSWQLLNLPVPAELIVYTVEEWRRLKEKDGRFARMLKKEVKWIYRRSDK
jgi:predicted nucleotidyltransferase